MKLGKTLKGILGAVAPTVATAIGGPFGGMAASFVLEKLGVETDGTDPAIQLETLAASANPELLFKIKQADIDFKAKMAELGVKETELEIKDRDSARTMAATQGIAPQMILSGIYTLGYFILVGVSFSGSINIPDELRTEFTAAMSFLTGIQLQIMNFWFGSSAGSAAKTDLLKPKSE